MGTARPPAGRPRPALLDDEIRDHADLLMSGNSADDLVRARLQPGNRVDLGRATVEVGTREDDAVPFNRELVRQGTRFTHRTGDVTGGGLVGGRVPL